MLSGEKSVPEAVKQSNKLAISGLFKEALAALARANMSGEQKSGSFTWQTRVELIGQEKQKIPLFFSIDSHWRKGYIEIRLAFSKKGSEANQAWAAYEYFPDKANDGGYHGDYQIYITNAELLGLGIGSAIFSNAETFKTALISKLAAVINCQKIVTRINDRSKGHWSSRQAIKNGYAHSSGSSDELEEPTVEKEEKTPLQAN